MFLIEHVSALTNWHSPSKVQTLSIEFCRDGLGLEVGVEGLGFRV